MTDHAVKAAQLISNLSPVTTDSIAAVANVHAILALVDRLDEISCVVAIPVSDDDE